MSSRARNSSDIYGYMGKTERTLLEPAKEHAHNDNDSAVTSIYRSSHPPRNIQELYISRGRGLLLPFRTVTELSYMDIFRMVDIIFSNSFAFYNSLCDMTRITLWSTLRWIY